MNKEYPLQIDPHILELLGPSLYTNIYYILAELIANAYDADAENVYIIANKDNITVEDDGKGMSYANGEIAKYLNVASVSRDTEAEAFTKIKNRRKMGRKGVGKLAALSVSENVWVKTVSSNEKSGFILSRHISDDKLLTPLPEEKITFEKISGSGTSIVMLNPQYKLYASNKAIKRNLLRIFPLVDKDFRIHIIRGKDDEIIESLDKVIIKELSTLVIMGEEYFDLKDIFEKNFDDAKITKQIDSFCKTKATVFFEIEMKNKKGETKIYPLEIKGWIGTYLTTKGRKSEMTDFPDNFISLYANKKIGEFNILPLVGQNKLVEVYIVGQLHVDLFELTELPDMALSNRQGYKSDDDRYVTVLAYVKDKLLPEIIRMRHKFVELKNQEKEARKITQQLDAEAQFRESVNEFRLNTSKKAANKISEKFGLNKGDALTEIENIVNSEINTNSPEMGIKSIVDAQKKKILISQTLKDKDLADIIYNMLIFNNIPAEDIIYTNCDDEKSRIPEGVGIYNYLRDFFVDSYSTQKIYVIFVTSCNTKMSWGALTEVGAAWITQVEHKIFNIYNFRPEHPLDDEQQWHSSFRDERSNDICMTKLNTDIFAQKIEHICDMLQYKKKNRQENKDRLATLVNIKEI